MNKKTAIIFTLILTTLFGCKIGNSKKEESTNTEGSTSKNERTFSKGKNLSEYPRTQFIPTLEHELSGNNNSVYCATLLLAWDEIRKQIDSPFTISDEYVGLKLLNQSTSFMDVLKTNEYNASGGITSGGINKLLITSRAEFDKSLPFEFKLQHFDNKLIFDKQEVASFGIKGTDSYTQQKIVEIVYYANDNNFILKLVPKDKEHEIILFKTAQHFNSIADMTVEIERLTEIGINEKQNKRLDWKYYYYNDDIVVIPKFNFNIETTYDSLIGNSFIAEKDTFLIDYVWQRTAFLLEESGAEIESESKLQISVAGIDSEEEKFEKPISKKMIFDKPFLVLLKRTDAKYPYFGLWTTNTELMIKE